MAQTENSVEIKPGSLLHRSENNLLRFNTTLCIPFNLKEYLLRHSKAHPKPFRDVLVS